MQILESISIIIACWTAIYGISAWRREYVGKRRIDLAEDVLALFYEARDAIRSIRSPFGWEGEGSSRKARDGETREEKSIRDQAYVVVERYEERQELFNKLHAMRYRFMAVYGQQNSKAFDDLWKVTRDIWLASDSLSWLCLHEEQDQMSQEQRKERKKKIHEARAILWQGFDSSDPIAPRVETIVEEIESICGGTIRQQSTLRRWIERIKNGLRQQTD